MSVQLFLLRVFFPPRMVVSMFSLFIHKLKNIHFLFSLKNTPFSLKVHWPGDHASRVQQLVNVKKKKSKCIIFSRQINRHLMSDVFHLNVYPVFSWTSEWKTSFKCQFGHRKIEFHLDMDRTLKSKCLNAKTTTKKTPPETVTFTRVFSRYKWYHVHVLLRYLGFAQFLRVILAVAVAIVDYKWPSLNSSPRLIPVGLPTAHFKRSAEGSTQGLLLVATALRTKPRRGVLFPCRIPGWMLSWNQIMWKRRDNRWPLSRLDRWMWRPELDKLLGPVFNVASVNIYT